MVKTETNKVSIIGAGFVGSTTAYSLVLSGLVSELVLIDINKKKAEGEVMDLNHGVPFVRPVKITAGGYEDVAGSDIIIITAGANIKPSQSRLEIVQQNTEIFKKMIPEIVSYARDAILLIVTNPVDIMTYVTLKLSGLPKNRVIGSGTVLDTARFKYLISEHVGVDMRNIHGYILGEHGDSEVAVWSMANIAGMELSSFCNDSRLCPIDIDKESIAEDVKRVGYEIMERKGATHFAVALAVTRIVEGILRDENSILTVSSLMEGQYGIDDVCISVPSVVNRKGVGKTLNIPLEKMELEKLQASGRTLKEVIASLEI